MDNSFDRAWWTATFILVILHASDMPFFDSRLNMAGWILLAGLRSLPRQPFEAAELDGVPEYYKFFMITLPMLFPFILTASLFRLLESIQQFDIIYALSQGGPGESSMVFQVSAYLQTFQYTNIGKAAAMMVVLWAICYFLCHVFVQQWHKLKIKTKFPKVIIDQG